MSSSFFSCLRVCCSSLVKLLPCSDSLQQRIFHGTWSDFSPLFYQSHLAKYRSWSAKILKAAAGPCSRLLTPLMNLSFESGVFPDRLKIARITPIFKGGAKFDRETKASFLSSCSVQNPWAVCKWTATIICQRKRPYHKRTVCIFEELFNHCRVT